VAAISMSGSSLLVALNAVALKRLRLPGEPPPSDTPRAEPRPGRPALADAPEHP